MTVVTGDLIAFHKRRAARLRAEAYRSAWRSLWALLAGLRSRAMALKFLRRFDRIDRHRTVA